MLNKSIYKLKIMTLSIHAIGPLTNDSSKKYVTVYKAVLTKPVLT